MCKRKTTAQFIEEAKAVHGEKYDYSKVVYVSANKKVEIICKKHGVFLQVPDAHRRGQNCPICTGRYMDREIFIRKAKEKHRNKYDYTKVIYKNSQKKVIITCLKHGDFTQRPASHIHGRGCPVCRYISSGLNQRHDTQSFIELAKKKHGNTYDYSKSNYITYVDDVEIICKHHGSFMQPAGRHISGAGCYQCGIEAMIQSNLNSLDYVLNKFRAIHGKRYDYSLVDYTGCHKKVIIICRKHGRFRQTPALHMFGQNCPLCKSSKGEDLIRLFLVRHKVTFEKEKKFSSCKNVNPLPFDFWLPEYDTLIEYDGSHHYQKDHFFYKKNTLGYKQRIRNDEIKNKWAKENNYKLIRISYKDKNKIDQILNFEISKTNIRSISKQLLLF